MAEDGKIITLDSTNLANELYDLNCKLNKLEKYPAIRVQELRDIVSTGIARINGLLKSGDDCVHTKIWAWNTSIIGGHDFISDGQN